MTERKALDCFASLAMTGREALDVVFLHRNMVAFTTLLTSNGLSAAISLKGRQT
jgi:hypothetical protein